MISFIDETFLPKPGITMSPTIKEVAKACGLSVSTTSCALRGVGRVAPETAQRVRQVARKLGYKPNVSARAIRTGQFGAFTLLLAQKASSGVISQSMLWGIMDVLEQNSLHLNMVRLPATDGKRQKSLPKVLTEQFTDGVLINYNVEVPVSLADELNSHGLPYVWLNHRTPFNAVYPNDFEGARFVTEALLQSGRKRIAYANFYLHDQNRDLNHHHYSFADRWQGYRLVMEQAGLPPLEIYSPQKLNAARRVAFAKEWLSREDRPEAIICYNEWTSRAVGVAARLLGLELPRELVIVSFDDEEDDLLDLPICHVRIAFGEIGREGCRMLLERLQTNAPDLPSRALNLRCDGLHLLS
ncbi:MAG: LacI family transcriptional regulator [Lentisphaerae bacterium]|nr:MAG: LacI family transcriptional regulator [Lentisphaerota bacterium]